MVGQPERDGTSLGGSGQTNQGLQPGRKKANPPNRQSRQTCRPTSRASTPSGQDRERSRQIEAGAVECFASIIMTTVQQTNINAVFTDLPNGIEGLRRLILEMAIRGRLVRQDSKEESAAATYQRVYAKKNGTPNSEVST